MATTAWSTRARLLTVRASEGEFAMLSKLAEADGLSMSDITRVLVRHAYVARFGDVSPFALHLKPTGATKGTKPTRGTRAKQRSK